MKFVTTVLYMNTNRIIVDGYFGDMDKYYNADHNIISIEDAKNLAAALIELMNNKEDYEDMDKDDVLEELKDKGFKIREDDLPYDYDFDSIATIESVEIIVYDEYGLGHNVTLED